jgi:hypothetical protein
VQQQPSPGEFRVTLWFFVFARLKARRAQQQGAGTSAEICCDTVNADPLSSSSTSSLVVPTLFCSELVLSRCRAKRAARSLCLGRPRVKVRVSARPRACAFRLASCILQQHTPQDPTIHFPTLREQEQEVMVCRTLLFTLKYNVSQAGTARWPPRQQPVPPRHFLVFGLSSFVQSCNSVKSRSHGHG